MYKIRPYSYNRAKELGIDIKPSTRKGKKIDVFDKYGNYIVSIGDIRYADYPTYIEMEGETFANSRRKLYKIRHEKDRKQVGSAGYYADKLLW